MKAIRYNQTGGPDVMALVDISLPEPASHEVRIRHTVIGVNFIDTYFRSGLYPQEMPAGLGAEAAGIVEAVGADVTHVQTGDRVVYFHNVPGAYATHRNLPGHIVVKLPDSVADDQAAALWLKACTAEALVERCARVQAGQTILVQAAAGGVGVLLCQWLKSAGATVIGTVGNPDKRAIAVEAGCDHVIDYADVPRAARELTSGRGVDAVLDGVGAATFEASLESLKKRGIMVSFGNASGAVREFDFMRLARGGSLFATRPSLFDYYASPEDFAVGTKAVFAKIQQGILKAHIGQSYTLEQVAQCHQDMEARRTVGSSVLRP